MGATVGIIDVGGLMTGMVSGGAATAEAFTDARTDKPTTVIRVLSVMGSF
jgi:hypothetical protein